LLAKTGFEGSPKLVPIPPPLPITDEDLEIVAEVCSRQRCAVSARRRDRARAATGEQPAGNIARTRTARWPSLR